MTVKANTLKSLHVGCPNLGNKQRFLSMVDDIWQSKRLTNDGTYVKEFENQIMQFLGVKHAVAVCNATTGIQILANATLKDCALVLVPSFTFVATVYAINWIGMWPTFVDVSLKTHNVHESVLAEWAPNNVGLLAPHLWGRPCPIDKLKSKPVIFDAAHAFGCSYNGTKIGNFGMGEVFSFHATKIVNSFEGGVITTNSDEIAQKCMHLRNFGFVGYDKSTDIGINGKMSEIHAAMGLCSLDHFDSFVNHNRKMYEQYCNHLLGINGMKIVRHDPKNTPNYQYVVLEVENRDKILDALWNEQIYARRYFYPGVHKMSSYKDRPLYLHNTEKLASQILVLPSGTATTSRDVARICNIIKKEVTR